MMRQWGGIVDVCPDACPIIGKTPVEGLLLQLRLGHRRLQGDAGLGLGLRAHDRARTEPHPLNAPFALERFATGHLIDEHGAAGVAH